MKIFRFDPGTGHEIKEYGSYNIFMTLIVEIQKSAVVHWMYFDPQGKIGRHSASSPQLFLVIEGEGWGSSDNPGPVPVTAGDAVFWDTGEWHEAGTDQGMKVIVIESTVPDPAAFAARV